MRTTIFKLQSEYLRNSVARIFHIKAYKNSSAVQHDKYTRVFIAANDTNDVLVGNNDVPPACMFFIKFERAIVPSPVMMICIERAGFSS